VQHQAAQETAEVAVVPRERAHLLVESGRGREPPPPPPEPRRSLTERFRPETLSAYIAGAGGGEGRQRRARRVSSARSGAAERPGTESARGGGAFGNFSQAGRHQYNWEVSEGRKGAVISNSARCD
jgi:hypothetical protein